MQPLIKSPILYRGDSFRHSEINHSDFREKGKTWAEFYKTEGLMAKFNSGGDLRIMQNSLEYLVASHVGYERHAEKDKVTKEQYIANKSPFISFTTDINSAGYFMDRTKKQKLNECDLGEATHFIWKLNQIECKENRPGWFSFIYHASIENVKNFLQNDQIEIQKALINNDTDKIGKLIGGLIVSSNTLNDNGPHYADLIDVTTFLKNKSSVQLPKDLIDRAIQRAEFSSEWLLFPKDPFPQGGYCSRFCLNKYLILNSWAKKDK